MTRIAKLTPAAQSFILDAAHHAQVGALRCPAITPEAARDNGVWLGQAIARAMREGEIVALDDVPCMREVAAVSVEGREVLRKHRQGAML